LQIGKPDSSGRHWLYIFSKNPVFMQRIWFSPTPVREPFFTTPTTSFYMKKQRLFPIFLFMFSLQLQAQHTVGLFLNDSLSVNGYTLFGNGKTAYLIDNCGFVVNTWESNFNSNTSMYLLENGNLLRTCRVGGSFNGGGIAGRIELFNWDGDLLWFYNYATAEHHQHHDIEPLPNGHFLLIAWEARTQIEAIEAGRDPDSVGNGGMWPEQIMEIEMVGDNEINVPWEWHLWDHLVQDFDSTRVNYGVAADHPELIDVNIGDVAGGFPNGGADWVHLNAIDYNPELDQVVMSSRHLNEVWIIDHSTTTAEAASHAGGNSGKGGDLLYRWGNPENYGRGTSDDQTLFGQHNVTWILEDSHPYFGKLMVYNNGQGRPAGNFSTVDIWTPPTDQNGQYLVSGTDSFGPDALDWTFTEPGFFSTNISGVHSLPNGNQFICEGNDGRFFEVTLDGEVVWEYINPATGTGAILTQGQQPNNNSTFRATRYPADYAAFEGKDLTPGAPVEIDPLPSDCVIYDGTTVGSTEVLALQGAWLRNNPVDSKLIVQNETGGSVILEVWDLMGHLVGSKRSDGFQISLDAANWVSGFYLLCLSNVPRTQSLTQKFIKN